MARCPEARFHGGGGGASTAYVGFESKIINVQHVSSMVHIKSAYYWPFVTRIYTCLKKDKYHGTVSMCSRLMQWDLAPMGVRASQTEWPYLLFVERLTKAFHIYDNTS